MKYTDLQLGISIPFSYANAVDRQTNVALVHGARRGLIDGYVRALSREMENLSADTDRVRVNAVRFVGGYIHMLDEKRLGLLLETLSRCFHLAEDTELTGIVSPGFYNNYPFESMVLYGIRAIMDVPSFDVKECQRHAVAYKAALSFADVEEHGVKVIGVRTLKGLDRRDARQWEAAYAGLMKHNPSIIEFVDTQIQQDSFLYGETLRRLEEAGYTQYQPDCLGLITPKYRLRTEDLPQYLGVGLSAACRFDGYYTRNTDDLNAYISADGDFSKLYKEAGEG